MKEFILEITELIICCRLGITLPDQVLWLSVPDRTRRSLGGSPQPKLALRMLQLLSECSPCYGRIYCWCGIYNCT